MDFSGKSLKSQLKRADKLNSSYTLIIGEKEIEEKHAILRNMQTKVQHDVPLNNFLVQLINTIRKVG
jgi:histidyl-tRNA synthetase